MLLNYLINMIVKEKPSGDEVRLRLILPKEVPTVLHNI